MKACFLKEQRENKYTRRVYLSFAGCPKRDHDRVKRGRNPLFILNPSPTLPLNNNGKV
jgi:hypothetical protein